MPTRCDGSDYTFVIACRVGLDSGSPIMNDSTHDNQIDPVDHASKEPVVGTADLKPKGACWYCNQPLDNVRRFCNKTCAEDYRTEEEAFKDASR